MKKAAGLKLMIAALLSLGTVSSVFACACCAEPGELQRGKIAVDDYIGGELASIRFSRKAHLFTTAAGWDDIKGISSPGQVEEYRLTARQDGTHWTLQFAGDPQNTGTLNFVLPARLELYAIDTTPQPGRSTKLRKEWRLDFPVRGNGMFGDGLDTGDPQGRLVLHGKGNACTDATQFGYWTLDVRSTRAKFRFYGKLKPPGS